MKKQFIATTLAITCLCSSLFAEINFSLSEFEKAGTKGDFGWMNVDGNSFIKTGISPDFKFGMVDLGIDLNLYIPMGNVDKYPSDFQTLALRHVGFNYKNRHGFRWGHLKNITLGYGLLVDRYNSGSGGTGAFSTDKAGFLGYTTLYNVRVDGLYTATNVKGGRISYTIPASPIMGSPIVFGATYVTDTDGIDNDATGFRVTRPSQDGVAADIGLPIAGQFLTAYLEYAQLIDQGSGGSLGIKGDFFQVVDYRAEYRVLGEKFVPGYFNNSYEATSFTFTDPTLHSDRLNGFLVGANATLFKGYFKTGLQYEKYESKDLLTAALGWQKIARTVGVINYNVPFQGEKNATGTLDVVYETGNWFDYLISVKRTYITSSTYTESYKMGLRFNLNRFTPKTNWIK